MGVECCRVRTDIDPQAYKIICLKAKDSHFYIHIFNCQNELSNEIEINPRLVQIEGMAQLSIDNTLYLIGSSNEKESKDQHQSRAKCLNINTIALPISFNFELSSKYHHHYPSLCYHPKEGIFVIGGKGSTRCELFSIDKKAWTELADLPSERYGCSITCFGAKHQLIAFGGANSVSGQLSNEILQLSTNKQVWDKVGELQDPNIRAWSGVINYNDSIILFGGVDQNNKPTDDICSVDMSDSYLSTSTISNLNLSTTTKFQFIFSYGYHNGVFFLFDEEDFRIHKVLLNPKKSEVFSFYHTANAY